MAGQESKDQPPTKSSFRSKLKNRVRASLPPLRPLSIKPRYGDWPSTASDDLGVWLNSPLPAVGRSLTPRESPSLEPTLQEGVKLTRDRLAFFHKECSKIIDYIYIGSDAVAKNRDVLLQNGITHVLNCVGYVCPEYFKDEFVYRTLWLHDTPCEDITSILYDVYDYFEDVKEHGGRVFVHCSQGVSRSRSLVIAYLMWKEEKSFEDALQQVKAVRGVTDPNMGFACQLLLCQKRVHALPASPNSILRMYRMAPHSSYDPLHLVPKMLDESRVEGLDSRGAFIIHIPAAIYVWVGDKCISMMAESAKAAASQIIHYEKAQGPAVIIKEGEEPSGFWEALGIEMADAGGGQRQVESYNVDFQIFHKAVSGGVIPPFPLSGNGIVTYLPARESGWSKLRRKLITGIIKDFITSTKLYSSTPGRSLDLSSRLSYSSVESFGKPASGYASPSLSPSNYESFCSFNFSPPSSNLSHFSNLDTQDSPVTSEGKDPYHPKVDSLDDPAVLLSKEVFPSEKASSAIGSLQMVGTFSPSVTEGRGKIPVPEVMLPSRDLQNLSRSCSFSLMDPEDKIMKDVNCQKPEKEESADIKKKDSI